MTACPHCTRVIRPGAWVFAAELGWAHQECAWCALLVGLGAGECRCAAGPVASVLPYLGARAFRGAV